jgi:uncharacterized protein YbaR (Trm112 family)
MPSSRSCEADGVQLDPVLLEIVACPCEAHAPLREGTAEDAAAEVLQCTRCLTTFRVDDDIPVLLLDEATPGPQGIGADVTGGSTS